MHSHKIGRILHSSLRASLVVGVKRFCHLDDHWHWPIRTSNISSTTGDSESTPIELFSFASSAKTYSPHSPRRAFMLLNVRLHVLGTLRPLLLCPAHNHHRSTLHHHYHHVFHIIYSHPLPVLVALYTTPRPARCSAACISAMAYF